MAPDPANSVLSGQAVHLIDPVVTPYVFDGHAMHNEMLPVYVPIGQSRRGGGVVIPPAYKAEENAEETVVLSVYDKSSFVKRVTVAISVQVLPLRFIKPPTALVSSLCVVENFAVSPKHGPSGLSRHSILRRAA